MAGKSKMRPFLDKLAVKYDDLLACERRYVNLEAAAIGRGTGSEASVSEELRGLAEVLAKDGYAVWASHLIAKADALDAALAEPQKTQKGGQE